MTGCIAEPISWLRLERYQLNELPAAQHAQITQHLASCPSCQSCFERVKLGSEALALPLPAAKSAAPRARRGWVWPMWAGMGIAMAAALLMLWTGIEQNEATKGPRSRTLRTKGGEFALEIVRRDAQGRLQDASHFSPSDRFKVLLTCPPSWQGQAQLVVFQAGHTYFPLPTRAVTDCGNRRSLAGAFQLDGTSPASVCLAMGATPTELSTLARGMAALPKLSVCSELKPASTTP
jgi:hypothetical protein